jgi:hypothetical protein
MSRLHLAEIKLSDWIARNPMLAAASKFRKNNRKIYPADYVVSILDGETLRGSVICRPVGTDVITVALDDEYPASMGAIKPLLRHCFERAKIVNLELSNHETAFLDIAFKLGFRVAGVMHSENELVLQLQLLRGTANVA